MKKSFSRASRVSNDAADFVENSFPGIPDNKWHEFLEKEETDMLILGLREEILHKCMEICFENYLEKQAVAFTVHCAYLAWCKVLNVYYMFRDPSDTDDPKEQKSWEPDPEPEPSIIDSWGSHCIVPVETEQEVKETGKEPEKSVCMTPSVRTVCKEESIESCPFASDLFIPEESEYFLSPEIYFSSTASTSRSKKSLFSTALCMSVESMSDSFSGSLTHNEMKKSCGNTKK